MWSLSSNFHPLVASTWLKNVLILCVLCWIYGYCTSSWKFPLLTKNNHAALMMLLLDLDFLTPSWQCTQLILFGIFHSLGKAGLCNYIPYHCSLFHLRPCCCALLFLILGFWHMSKKPCRCGDWSDGPIQCPLWLLVVVPLSVESPLSWNACLSVEGTFSQHCLCFGTNFWRV